MDPIRVAFHFVWHSEQRFLNSPGDFGHASSTMVVWHTLHLAATGFPTGRAMVLEASFSSSSSAAPPVSSEGSLKGRHCAASRQLQYLSTLLRSFDTVQMVQVSCQSEGRATSRHHPSAHMQTASGWGMGEVLVLCGRGVPEGLHGR
jgi:hypothetical protein